MRDNSVNAQELISWLIKAKVAFSDSPILVRKIEGMIEDLNGTKHVFLEHIISLADEMSAFYLKNLACNVKKSGERNHIICSIMELVGLGFLIQSRDEQ